MSVVHQSRIDQIDSCALDCIDALESYIANCSAGCGQLGEQSRYDEMATTKEAVRPKQACENCAAYIAVAADLRRIVGD